MSREEYRTQRELLREIEDLHRQMAAMRCDLDALTHSKPWRLYLFFANLFHFIVRFRSLQGTKRNTKKILISLKHRINRHPALKSCIMGMLSHFPRLEYRLKRLGHFSQLRNFGYFLNFGSRWCPVLLRGRLFNIDRSQVEGLKLFCFS